MADMPEGEPRVVQLDAATTLQERMALADVKERASAGRAQMIEDYLTNRVLVLATHNTQLMAANEAIAAKVGELEAAIKGEGE
jgi:hypothetical protein